MMVKDNTGKRASSENLTAANVSNVLRGKVAGQIDEWTSDAVRRSGIGASLASLKAQLEDDSMPASVKASLRDAVASLEDAQEEDLKATLQVIAKGVVHLMNDLKIPVTLKSQQAPNEAVPPPAAARSGGRGRPAPNKQFILDYLRRSAEGVVPVAEIIEAAVAAGLKKTSVQQAFTPMRKNGDVVSAGRGRVSLPK